MSFLSPVMKGYTVYSKSGCPFCVKVKYLLGSMSVSADYINCDEYLLNDRDGFLAFIRAYIGGRDWRTFPMVFLDGVFIGGYMDTKAYLEKENAFESLDF
jgi:glutaredoxin